MRYSMIAIGIAALLTFAARLDAQGFDTVVRVRLAADTTIDGFRCAATGRAYAEFHQDGQLASCPLAEATTVAGHALPAGTWIQITDAGRLWSVWLPEDTRLAGHLCHGTGYKGWAVRFHENGALMMCYLGAEASIDGVWCQRGTFWNEIRGGTRTSVSFDDSGRFRRCQASRDFEKDGVRVRKWQVVEVDENGKLSVRSR